MFWQKKQITDDMLACSSVTLATDLTGDSLWLFSSIHALLRTGITGVALSLIHLLYTRPSYVSKQHFCHYGRHLRLCLHRNQETEASNLSI